MNRTLAAALVASLAAVASLPTAEAQVEGHVTVSAGATVGNPPPPRRYRRAPGPRLMAPLMIDLGGIMADSDYGLLGGAEASIGIHWASLSPVPTNFDIGLGVFGGVMNNANVPDDANGDPEVLGYGGLYAEYGHRLSGGDFWRTWARGRAEYLGSEFIGEEHRGIGVAGKLEAEIFLSGVGVSPEGLFVGTYALGVYVEGAVRRLSDKVSDVQIGAGISIRTPAVWRW